MADKMLKDVIKCECGFEMFPYAIHKDDETVLYKCISENCECTKLLSLREATLGPEDMFTYFCLDDDGNMYWKCGIHGNCQSDLKWLASGWKNKVNKFIDYGCGYELDIEEVMDELDNTEEHEEELCALFEHLNEEDVERIADAMGIEIENGYTQAFLSDFSEQIGEGLIYTWQGYLDNVILTMGSLDLLKKDEYENIDED